VQLKLKDKYLKLVKEDKKHSTIREGIRPLDLKLSLVGTPSKEVVEVSLRGLYYKYVRDLTESDAIKDGFNTLEELKKVLFTIYPKLKENDFVTIFSFRLKKREVNNSNNGS